MAAATVIGSWAPGMVSKWHATIGARTAAGELSRRLALKKGTSLYGADGFSMLRKETQDLWKVSWYDVIICHHVIIQHLSVGVTSWMVATPQNKGWFGQMGCDCVAFPFGEPDPCPDFVSRPALCGHITFLVIPLVCKLGWLLVHCYSI